MKTICRYFLLLTALLLSGPCQAQMNWEQVHTQVQQATSQRQIALAYSLLKEHEAMTPDTLTYAYQLSQVMMQAFQGYQDMKQEVFTDRSSELKAMMDKPGTSDFVKLYASLQLTFPESARQALRDEYTQHLTTFVRYFLNQPQEAEERYGNCWESVCCLFRILQQNQAEKSVQDKLVTESTRCYGLSRFTDDANYLQMIEAYGGQSQLVTEPLVQQPLYNLEAQLDTCFNEGLHAFLRQQFDDCKKQLRPVVTQGVCLDQLYLSHQILLTAQMARPDSTYATDVQRFAFFVQHHFLPALEQKQQAVSNPSLMVHNTVKLLRRSALMVAQKQATSQVWLDTYNQLQLCKAIEASDATHIHLNHPSDYQSIRSALADSIRVEYVELPDTAQPAYGAFVFGQKDAAPQLIRICPVSTVRSLLTQYTRTKGEDKRQQLRTLLLQPLENSMNSQPITFDGPQELLSIVK